MNAVASDSAIIHRLMTVQPATAVTSSGVWIQDDHGKRYMDASGGAAVSCLGHAHPEVLAAMHQQIDKLAYAHTGFFTTEVAENLAHQLVQHAPAGLEHVYFVSGGSEAVEAALKMARQYFVEIGQPQRQHFIARKQSYHGNTLGALSVSGNAWRRAQFEPLLIDVKHVSPCYAYRDQVENETPQAYGVRLVQELSDAIDTLGGENVIAFVAETVGGATAGVLPPVEGYFKGVRALCDRHGILLILDEVMCGMGRTGSLHACEQEGVAPDLLTIAKGLGGGYQPIGAVLAHTRIAHSFAKGSGLFQHGHTYIGHAVACAAALAVQTVIQRDNLVQRVQELGTWFGQALRTQFEAHESVGDVRGRGLFWGIELVADKGTKKWFEPSRKVHAAVKRAAMKEGLMVYPMGGTVDGRCGDHILLAPPFIASQDELAQVIERLARAIDSGIASAQA